MKLPTEPVLGCIPTGFYGSPHSPDSLKGYAAPIIKWKTQRIMYGLRISAPNIYIIYQKCDIVKEIEIEQDFYFHSPSLIDCIHYISQDIWSNFL